MFRFITWFLIIPLGALVVAFTVSNRNRITIDLWPAPLSLEIPIFAAILAAVFFGFLLGSLVSFFSASRRIFLNRHLSKALKNAKQEKVTLKQELKKFEEASAEPSARSEIQP